jgi:hypothetical protein
MGVDSLDLRPFALMHLAGSADLSLVVNSPERADAPGEDRRVEASMDDDWPSQVARRDIKARKNQACQRRKNQG